MRLKFKYRVAVLLLSLISKTWRIRIFGEIPESTAVFAFWHGEMMPIWKFFSKMPISKTAVVSLSKDGDILSQLLRIFGYQLLRGSSSKNSKETLALAVDAAEVSSIFITPDGPRGPRCEFKAGAAVIAFRSQKPLYLIRCKFSFAKVFEKSWDKFTLPIPFSTIELHISKPFNISNEATRDEIDEYIKYYGNYLNNMI